MQWGVRRRPVIPAHRVTLGVIAIIILAARRATAAVVCIALPAIANAIPRALEAPVATGTAAERTWSVVTTGIAVPRARLVAAQPVADRARIAAATGRFAEAKTTANKALSAARAAGREDLAGEIQERIKLYEAGQPYRQK